MTAETRHPVRKNTLIRARSRIPCTLSVGIASSSLAASHGASRFLLMSRHVSLGIPSRSWLFPAPRSQSAAPSIAWIFPAQVPA